ncbi:unnamed protein product, partial [Toxocara canis]|uniref:Methyltransf_11 domain-containing protein n=1 Tax=Toxocara canis TaxID=6265 RepID=A0A183V7P3_TOXCA
TKCWERNTRNFSYQEQFDFIVSYSSIEHSGLGRFGDPLDPKGDLREMQKIQCLLKRGGLLFLGLPCGADALVFNAHRLYGRLRLPMMFQGFKFLNMFVGNAAGPVQVTDEMFNEPKEEMQPTFVLQRE